MKRYLPIIFLIFAKPVFSQGYQVNLQAPQYKSGIAYLVYHMGGTKLSVQDSAAIRPNGTAVFSGKEKLPGGIYAIVFPGQRFSLDFFVDKEQKIQVKADTTDLLNKTLVTGSKENALYVQYQKFVAVKGKSLQQEKTAYSTSKTKADSALHEANYNKYNKELNAYRENIIKTQPKSMMAALLTAMREPTLPVVKPVSHQDSLANYYYYKKHFWDGITFMDERIIRTPFFLPKLERYYREIVPQMADSLIAEADYQLLLARTCPEMYKYLLNWLTDEYINPKYMGQDKVFAHLYTNYHAQGVSKWLSEEQMKIISRRYYMIAQNIIGDKAADLEMADTDGKTVHLYDIKADYTLVCFWDPNCGHCKEIIPQIDSIYEAKWKNYNMKVYSVLSPDGEATEKVKTEWINFIKQHNLGGWTNVYETPAMEAAVTAAQKPSYRQLYDVILTPTIFLLDKDKNIIGKKLTWQQLDEMLQYRLKTKE